MVHAHNITVFKKIHVFLVYTKMTTVSFSKTFSNLKPSNLAFSGTQNTDVVYMNDHIHILIKNGVVQTLPTLYSLH